MNLAWRIEYDPSALGDLRHIDRRMAQRIVDYMDRRVAMMDNPRTLGKALKGGFGDFWRYRVGDYRVICSIEDKNVMVLVVRVGHRSDVYR